ncbi:hypothetical protein GQ42DRAFT_177924 [Ramicandelaber brevisporus]|nr:hypothetical protein GQ42DRAFT_177924 [Ramicandelaber brevisporus]
MREVAKQRQQQQQLRQQQQQQQQQQQIQGQTRRPGDVNHGMLSDALTITTAAQSASASTVGAGSGAGSGMASITVPASPELVSSASASPELPDSLAELLKSLSRPFLPVQPSAIQPSTAALKNTTASVVAQTTSTGTRAAGATATATAGTGTGTAGAFLQTGTCNNAVDGVDDMLLETLLTSDDATLAFADPAAINTVADQASSLIGGSGNSRHAPAFQKQQQSHLSLLPPSATVTASGVTSAASAGGLLLDSGTDPSISNTSVTAASINPASVYNSNTLHAHGSTNCTARETGINSINSNNSNNNSSNSSNNNNSNSNSNNSAIVTGTATANNSTGASTGLESDMFTQYIKTAMADITSPYFFCGDPTCPLKPAVPEAILGDEESMAELQRNANRLRHAIADTGRPTGVISPTGTLPPFKPGTNEDPLSHYIFGRAKHTTSAATTAASQAQTMLTSLGLQQSSSLFDTPQTDSLFNGLDWLNPSLPAQSSSSALSNTSNTLLMQSQLRLHQQQQQQQHHSIQFSRRHHNNNNNNNNNSITLSSVVTNDATRANTTAISIDAPNTTPSSSNNGVGSSGMALPYQSLLSIPASNHGLFDFMPGDLNFGSLVSSPVNAVPPFTFGSHNANATSATAAASGIGSMSSIANTMSALSATGLDATFTDIGLLNNASNNSNNIRQPKIVNPTVKKARLTNKSKLMQQQRQQQQQQQQHQQVALMLQPQSTTASRIATLSASGPTYALASAALASDFRMFDSAPPSLQQQQQQQQQQPSVPSDVLSAAPPPANVEVLKVIERNEDVDADHECYSFTTMEKRSKGQWFNRAVQCMWFVSEATWNR